MKQQVLLMGGIGNRLFQIARALSLREEEGVIEVIIIPKAIEIRAKIIGWSYHQQWIDLEDFCNRLNIKYRKATLIEILFIIKVYGLKKLLNSSKQFNKKLDNKEINKIDIGYFQSHYHVKKEAVIEIAHQLRNQLQLKSTSRTVVHIRGGDYTSEIRTSSADLNGVEEKYNEILYITNDAKHARHILKNKIGVTIQQSSSDLKDFSELCSAKKLYPTNSTFSFWAAAVVKESGGEVIRPSENIMWQLLEE
jgi:hypothetical protein